MLDPDCFAAEILDQWKVNNFFRSKDNIHSFIPKIETFTRNHHKRIVKIHTLLAFSETER